MKLIQASVAYPLVSQISQHFLSITRWIELKLHYVTQQDRETELSSNGHMIKMADMPIYDKTIFLKY